jgi:hypothetical protein
MNRRAKAIGWVNLVLAALGYCQLLLNVIGYHGLPASFIDEYGPFMRGRLPTMSIMSAILLALLAASGFLLVRGVKHSVELSNAAFVVEIVAMAIFCARWNFSISFLSLPVIASGLMNGAIALQIITLYPIVALIVLNLRPRSRPAGAEHA